jgi:hypothetical protein
MQIFFSIIPSFTQNFEIRCFNEPGVPREGTVEIDVWRPQGGNDYLLVGRQTATLICPGGICEFVEFLKTN